MERAIKLKHSGKNVRGEHLNTVETRSVPMRINLTRKIRMRPTPVSRSNKSSLKSQQLPGTRQKTGLTGRA
ncbi:hypothetical protein SAMN06265222_10634 [Neorhodopirellula lusitana]|uniref:Uncharacterized protein n=1 Tax=Neorhodopirellula lusitana TaxID=445327 RepID=A0ABY1Q7X3_9BACT|nr:hypothetical protein SAMN06265222_10634 [Neorhodopirellula lusitana]